MATKINIKNLPLGYQSIITNGKHSSGTDLGLAPTGLVLAGLAMCKVATVRFIARKNGWAQQIRDVDAFLEQEVKPGSEGKLQTNVKVSIRIEGDITEDQRSEHIRQADKCYIHRMLNGNWSIEEASEASG